MSAIIVNELHGVQARCLPYCIVVVLSLVSCSFDYEEVLIPIDLGGSVVMDFNAKRCGLDSCYKIPYTFSDSSCNSAVYVKNNLDSVRTVLAVIKSGCRINHLNVNYYIALDSMQNYFDGMKKQLRHQGWKVVDENIVLDSIDGLSKFVGENGSCKVNVGVFNNRILRNTYLFFSYVRR